MTTVAPDTTFQATDLARRARDVMSAARLPGGALIRDKDGTSFLLAPAGTVSREHYVLAGMKDAVRVLRLVAMPRSPDRDPVLYGDFAWLAELPDDAQCDFAWEYVRLLEAVPGRGTEPVEQMLYEWQQTARAYADEELRGELIGNLGAPLTDVEL